MTALRAMGKDSSTKEPTDAFTHGKEVENDYKNDDEDERRGEGKRTRRSQALHLGLTYSPW
jgi:hypothetical protein